MSDKHLKREPQKLKELHDGKFIATGKAWWYEEPDGITIVVGGTGIQLKIPWRQVRWAVARKNKP